MALHEGMKEGFQRIVLDESTYAMKIRGTATDKLVDVIQMLLFVHKTGILTVQREGPEHLLEEASVLFQNGQVIDATVDHLRGTDAVKKLNTWRKCYFIFQEMPLSAHTALPSSPGYANVERALSQHTSGTLFDPATSVIPYRAQQFRSDLPDFASMGLSRAHRQLYLLADGQRSIDVLSKLIGRNLQEVLPLLSDLENLGLLRRS